MVVVSSRHSGTHCTMFEITIPVSEPQKQEFVFLPPLRHRIQRGIRDPHRCHEVQQLGQIHHHRNVVDDHPTSFTISTTSRSTGTSCLLANILVEVVEMDSHILLEIRKFRIDEIIQQLLNF